VKNYWVYILLCENGSYYTGYTIDLERRYKEHVAGTVKCKYTRSFKPMRIAQAWQLSEGKSAALRLEKYIKKLSKQEKEFLIAEPKRIIDIMLNLLPRGEKV
jgi:putative endonuclease